MDSEPTVSVDSDDGLRSSAAAAILDSLERAESAETFYRGLLHAQVERSEAMHGVVWLAGQPGTGSLRLLCEEAARVGQQAATAWRAPLARQAASVFLSGQRHVERISEPADRLLQGRAYWGVGLPVPLGDKVVATVTLVVSCDEKQAIDYARVAAESVASQGLLYGTLQSSQHTQKRYDELCRAWDLVASVGLGYPDPEHMALAFANKAKDQCGSQRVSLGWARRGKVKLSVVSDQDYIDRRTNLSRALAAAMQEAHDADRAIVFPPSADDPSSAAGGAGEDPADALPAHAAVADLTEDSCVATYPLRAAGDTVAVVLFERQQREPFTEGERRLQSIACDQIGPELGLARQNARGVLARSRDGAIALIEMLAGKGHVVAKIITAVVLALVAVGIFAMWPLKVSGTALLSPAVRRVYAAPFDRAILREAMVLPGQIVKAGAPLFRFETEELDLAVREAHSKLAATRKKMDVYFSEQRMAEYKIAKAEVEELTAQSDLLEHRIRRAVVRATFDGIVLKGDLRQHIGNSFQIGQVLLEVAPLDELLLLMEVEQDDISYVTLEGKGTFVAKARPDVTLDFTVEKIRPMSETRDKANVFVVEARLQNTDGWLRPGMEGAANVLSGRHNIAWVFTRKPINWVRMKLLF
ncbi:efflux RND transporter periplasmic adaptor subunit [bacterium]|nr:efflux RND transporter periplasmic adaptor subunit [bacterium]